MPLHVWLPIAHPAAPSHVSALMSGVMIKMGIYGLLRAGLEWLGPGPAWWGVVLLLAGTVSAVKGVLYALVERDLKRLLAFSSIENVGIVLVGVGAGMVFHASGLEFLAVFALAAGLYHVPTTPPSRRCSSSAPARWFTRRHARHGGAGRAHQANAPHGLLLSRRRRGHRRTAAAERLRERMAHVSGAPGRTAAAPAELELSMVVRGGELALTSGLAAACFVKAFGITFLAIPRTIAGRRP